MPGGGGCGDGDDDGDIFINPEDGLRLENKRGGGRGGGDRVRGLLVELATAFSSVGNGGEGVGGGGGDIMKEFECLNLEEILQNEEDDEDEGHHFPTIVIAAGLTPQFFQDEPLKRRLESLFNLFAEQDSSPTFHYFPSFKRVRVTYENPASAIIARVKTDGTWLDNENRLKCFFGATPIGKSSKKCQDGLLHPPTPDKQFLISPPASPPVGWEPHPEYAPTIDFDLLSALSKLSPGETCELFKSESEKHPSIIVHIADDHDTTGDPAEEAPQQIKPKIMQTKRPS